MIGRLHMFSFVFVAGCQVGGGIVERLDRQSGLTVVTEPAPAVFARTQGQLSRSARDYLYLGPVEVNERGLRQYYLWVGMASTIDRAFLAADETEPEVLLVEIDGVPIEFELDSWDDRLPRLAGRIVYDTVVTPSRRLAARVTLDQLALISGGAIDRVRITSGETPTVEYFLWEASAVWPGFSAYAGIR